MQGKNKGGRPPKRPGERRRGNLTFRTTDGMRVQLGKAAAAAGRSISEEIEYRLERSFFLDDLLALARALRPTAWDAASFSLFSLFFQKKTASDFAFAAEILDFRAIEGRNNSENSRCFSLFPAVFRCSWRKCGGREDRDTGSVLVARSMEMRMFLPIT